MQEINEKDIDFDSSLLLTCSDCGSSSFYFTAVCSEPLHINADAECTRCAKRYVYTLSLTPKPTLLR